MINDSGFLPGIQLGYLMCDPCAYATKALQCVADMLAVNGSLRVLSDFSKFSPPVKAFLGERYSESSIPAAKLISLYKIPQISCTSSAAALSDKLRYTSFFRVIPSNIYQAKALAKLMRHFNWDWIGVVSLDDDYGKGIYENFVRHAEKERICFAFDEVVSNYNNVKQRIKEVADIIQNATATVVVLFLRIQQVEMLFEEMIKTNTSRIWISSNAWTMSRLLMKMKGINKLGDIIGTTFITGKIPGFEDYLQNLRPGPGVRNDFIREYKQMRFNCSQQSQHMSPLACNVTDPQEANDDYLLHAVDVTEAYSQRIAVYAVAHAMKKLLQCNDTACSGDTNLLTYKLVDILRKVNFTLDNQTYSFNENGDFENGYDVMMWKQKGDEKVCEVVGKFLIKNGDIEIFKHKIHWTNTTVPWSRCSKPCPPGTEKNISSISCCYNCINCAEGLYSNETDQDNCEQCPEGSWSLPGSKECQKWKVWFLEWSAAYSIVVMIGTVIGALLLVFSFIFYILHREKPIIKDILVISCLMKFGLMAVHIFLELMSSNPTKQRQLRKFDKPYVIIGILTVIQALICIFWMIFDPVNVEEKQSKTQLLTLNCLCTQGSMYGFGAMHVYIGLLGALSFGLAFKGRDNDKTDPIVFSMLIHLFAWLCFIPVFITQYESRPIVQISGIMVSNYGVVFCHFAPKWFKIISEKTLETVKTPNAPLTIDSDSGVIFNFSFGSRESIPSIPHSRFSTAESEPSNWDINSLHLSEISCTSSAPALSDKLRCPSFFRVIPSDVYQTKALAKLMAHFSWDWVGVVSLDDDYGKAAVENFLLDAEKEHVCAAFQEVVPHYLDNKYTEQRIKEVADRIRTSTAKVVLLILRPEQVEMLFEEMIKTNTTLTWIASDSWSTTRSLMKIKNINKVGEIFGFTFVTGKIPGFGDYLQNLRPGPGARNDFIEEYKQMRFNCSPGQQSEHTSPVACSVTDPQEANDDYLLHAVDMTEAYSQRVAVYAVAHAIKKLLQCNDTACSEDTNLLPWKLVEILHELNFTLDSQTFYFNQFGDFENGYDFIMWKKEDIDPPSTQSMFINLMCTEGSIIGFAVMHAYIAVLAFICFLLAFKSRKVPHDFNETGIIVFSMLIHLFVWLCFIPIYITKNEQRPIVQASAILVSNYGIIFCHFIPKCYQVLWEKTENSLSAIRQRLFAAVKASVPG
ncbi:hypothetical protein AOLI_G00035840 [Acnodon oligacanthus]